MKTNARFIKSLVVSILFLCALIQTTVAHAEEQYVVIAGYQMTESGKPGMTESEAEDFMDRQADKLDAIFEDAGLIEAVGGILHDPAVRPHYKKLWDGMQDLIQKKDAKVVPFVIYYINQAMRMNTEGQSIVWGVPENSPPWMALADHVKKRVVKMAYLRGRSNDAFSLMSGDRGTYSGMLLTPKSETEQIAGYTSLKHRYAFSVLTGTPGSPSPTDNTTSTVGYAWLSPYVEGFPIIEKFYDNFAKATENYNFMHGFGGGLGRSMADLTQNGVPHEDDTILTL